jgi:hypothetical protein
MDRTVRSRGKRWAGALLGAVLAAGGTLAAERVADGGGSSAGKKGSGSSASIEGRDAAAARDELSFVLGNVEYLLVHEIAHLLIAEKNIPIVGPVENAADYIATLALLREEPLDLTQRDRAEKFLLAAAGAFAASWRRGAELGAEAPYWGEHALSIQRYYQIACLLFGKDADAYADLPRAVGMPEARARGCVAEYARAARAVEWLLESYGRRPNDAPGAATEIVYEKPPTLVSARVVRELKSIGLLERVIDRLHERFTLEQPFTVTMRRCGRPEAAWMPDRRELAICYELVDALFLLARRADAVDLHESGAKRR